MYSECYITGCCTGPMNSFWYLCKSSASPIFRLVFLTPENPSLWSFWMIPIKKWQNQFQRHQGKKLTLKTSVINSSLAVGIWGYYSDIVFRVWHAIWHVLLLNMCPTCVNTFSRVPTISSSLFVPLPCAHWWPRLCVNSLSVLQAWLASALVLD